MHSAYLKDKELLKVNRGVRAYKRHTRLPLSQQQYEESLLNLIVEGTLPISIVSLDAFRRYTNGIFFISMHIAMEYRVIIFICSIHRNYNRGQ